MEKKIGTGYKLCEMDRFGKLHPLFIDRKEVFPINEWIRAKFIPTKDFAPRGGLHLGTVPDAPWLKGYNGTNVGVYKSCWKTGKRVWSEVQYNATICYDSEVALLKKKCFTDRCPENGYYLFREVGKGIWIVCSDMRIVRIIPEDERQHILKQMNYNEADAYAKYMRMFQKRMKIAI